MEWRPVQRIRHRGTRLRSCRAHARQLGESHRGSERQDQPRGAHRCRARCLLLDGVQQHPRRRRTCRDAARYDRCRDVRQDRRRDAHHHDGTDRGRPGPRYRRRHVRRARRAGQDRLSGQQRPGRQRRDHPRSNAGLAPQIGPDRGINARADSRGCGHHARKEPPLTQRRLSAICTDTFVLDHPLKVSVSDASRGGWWLHRRGGLSTVMGGLVMTRRATMRPTRPVAHSRARCSDVDLAPARR